MIEDLEPGIAVTQRTGTPDSTEVDQDVLGWHAVTMSVHWPENQAPEWHIDAFLAHALFKDVLHRHGSDMTVWRFHRRALRDAAGHRFSFRFYGNRELAGKIYTEVETHPHMRRLLNDGILSGLRTSPLAENSLPRIADTSDANWSPAMQASWPYFAMGVSQSWLALIDEIADTSPEPPLLAPFGAYLEFYRSVNDEVNRLWRHEGGHAYLHHLNALFGYREIIVRERRTTRF
jgi:hypothetical protein